MNRIRLVSAILCVAAVVLLGAIQALSWGHYEGHNSGGSVYGFTYPGSDVSVDARTWGMHVTANGNTDFRGWYSKDMDDQDGVALFRTAIPFLLAALAVGAVALLVTVFVARTLGPVLALVAGALATAATVLYSVATDQFYGDTPYSWHVAFYGGIVASACLLAAGVVALIVPRLRGSGVPAGLQ